MNNAGLAQLAEQPICNRPVLGSNPRASTTKRFSMTGKKHSPETREKMADARRAYYAALPVRQPSPRKGISRYGKCSQCDEQARSNGLCLKHYKASWYEQHREKMGAASKARYNANKAEILKANKERYGKNKDRRRAKNAALYQQKKDIVKQKNKEWRLANLEKCAAYAANRRARRRGADGSYTGKEVTALLLKQKGRCAICRGKLPAAYHKDHIIPLALGGANWISNIQLLCPPCNLTKGAKDPIEFMRQMGALL